MKPAPVSIIFAMVVDANNRKLYHEIEIVWDDGTVRSLRVDAHKSIRIDFDQLYARPSVAPPA